MLTICMTYLVLICKGDDAIRIWNLPGGDPVQIPEYESSVLGQVTALKWVMQGSKMSVRMVVGTGIGNVIMWSYDATEVGTRSRIIHSKPDPFV